MLQLVRSMCIGAEKGARCCSWGYCLAGKVTCRNGRNTRSPSRRITLKLHRISLQDPSTYLFRPEARHALEHCELCVSVQLSIHPSRSASIHPSRSAYHSYECS